jgi:hypothetical protein
MLYYADPDHTITGRVAHALLDSMLEWLEAEYRALSRENELCSDSDAAKQVGREEMARALMLLEGGGTRIADLVMKPLEQEMLGAIRAPTPPLQQILSRLDDIRAPEPLAAAATAGLKSEVDVASTHPPFGKRLANLGFRDVPAIDRVETSAIDQLLSQETAHALIARLDDAWRKRVEDYVGVGR